MPVKTFRAESYINLECDLCRSTLTYQGKRPGGWTEVWTSDRATKQYDMYSMAPALMSKEMREGTAPANKRNILCPRCTSWILPLLADSFAQDFLTSAIGKKKKR